MAGWFRGIVKEVPSGDTLVVCGKGPFTQVLPEKRIVLANLMAPKLGRRDGSTPDEEFAWEAREFLRSKAIGKEVIFRIDYVVEQISGMEFGSVMLGDENLALTVVTRGYARVKEGSNKSPYYDQLKELEEQAMTAGLGMHCKDNAARAAAVRTVPPQPEGKAFLEECGRGKPLPAIVEQVLNGSTLRLTIVGSHASVIVRLAGVGAPTMLPREGQSGPEFYAAEAKNFSELSLLNREVRVALQATDTYGNLFGAVFYEKDGGLSNLADAMAAQGLARYVEWSANTLENGRQLMYAVEKAKAAKIGMWRDYVPPATNSSKTGGKFTAKVIEIVSGDTLVVKDVNTGVEKRLSLSSVRAPRMRSRDDPKPEEWAWEARELLRKRLVGKTVEVAMEYSRKVEGTPGAGVMEFGNVAFDEKDQSGAMVQKTASQLVVTYGLAAVVRHREGDERSGIYEKLIDAEDFAKGKKNGMHGNKAAPVHHINDVSTPGSAKMAKQYLTFLQRGKTTAVCMHITQGHRLRLYVPKEGVQISFSPAGIKCPERSQPARPGQAATKGEPFGDDAFAYTREHVLQRTVEISVETMNKGGTFLGELTIPATKTNLGVALLDVGLGKTHEFFDEHSTTGGPALAAAQARAQAGKKGLWANYVPAAAPAALPATAERKKVEVTVTEVQDANNFFVQFTDDAANLDYVTEELGALSTGDAAAAPVLPPGAIVQGAVCYGQFSYDNLWYRAYVEKVHATTPAKYDVFFIDYGNRESLPADRVRPAEAKVAAVAPQARLASLAGVKPPGIDEDFGYDAARLLADIVAPGAGKKMAAWVERVDRTPVTGRDARHPKHRGGRAIITLAPDTSSPSVNAALVEAGLARLARPTGESKGEDALIRSLQSMEEKARDKRLGVFQYGDADSDSDDDNFPALGGRGGRGRR